MKKVLKTEKYKKWKKNNPNSAKVIETSAKVLKVAAITTVPVLPYLPLIGAGVGATIGVCENTSLLSLSLPSVQDVAIPTLVGGYIGYEAKRGIETVMKDGLSNPLALVEIGAGITGAITNLTINPQPSTMNTLSVVGASMLGSKVIKKTFMSGKELEFERKALTRRENKLKKDIKQLNEDFNSVKKQANAFLPSKPTNIEERNWLLDWDLDRFNEQQKARHKAVNSY